MAKICLWQIIISFYVLEGHLENILSKWFFSGVILTSHLSFVSLAYPFTSLFLFKSKHVGITVVLFQAFRFSCVFHDFSEVTVEIALGCIGPAGVNLINPCNLKQINFSINSVSWSSLFLPLFLLSFCWWCVFCLIAADLFVKKWSKKAQNASVFLALSIFFPTGYWNNSFLAALLTNISMELWVYSLHTLLFLILWCDLSVCVLLLHLSLIIWPTSFFPLTFLCFESSKHLWITSWSLTIYTSHYLPH